MKIIHVPQEMQVISKKYGNRSVGFIPTMGFLHDGHIALIMEAKKKQDIVIVSIFVNPLQFGPNEDLDQYPRDKNRDIKILEELEVDYVFIPSVNAMYPVDFRIRIELKERVSVMCGRSRPGHFDGVAAVIIKLFNIVNPTHAYFGLKDAQQFVVIQAIVEDLNINVELVGLKTIRETDGLAKSSRNVYLSELERIEAKNLYLSLKIAQNAVIQGQKNAKNIVELVKSYIKKTTSAEIDYIELLSYPDMKVVHQIENDIIVAGAIKFKKTRLIDNILLTENGLLK